VAKQITKYYPAFALLRRHPEPRYDAFAVLQATLKKRFNVELDVTTSKTLSDTLDHACSQSNDDFFKKLLRMMVTRCMNQARYFSSGSTNPAGFRHYGLAVDIYTHFTSPIRRYADVIVHRLLAASIGYQALTPHLNHHDVARTCDVINRRHRTADLAGRDSTRFHTFQYFKNRKLEPEPACILFSL
jgi:exosome complex exonuclease DIS3/RRP44